MAEGNQLQQFQKEHDFYVGLDSDGCVFDSMEIKHKECFAPMFIKHWELQAASKYARRAWEFANLYSVDRGANRFPVLVKSLDLIMDWPDAMARGPEDSRSQVLARLRRLGTAAKQLLARKSAQGAQ